MSLSGDDITNAIAKNHKLSLKQAEELKIKCGFNLKRCPLKIKKTINSIIASSSKNIKTELAFVNRALKEKTDKIYISGGVSQMSKITTTLSSKLKIKVRHANPLTNIEMGKKINLSNEDLLKFVTAIGLAIRGSDNNFLK